MNFHSCVIVLSLLITSLNTHCLSVRDQAAQNALSLISFSGSEDIMDIGSKDGAVAYYLSQLSPMGIVHGIDSSAKNISKSTKKYSAVGNLRFFYRDITEFYSLHHYDIVTAFFAINWANNPNNVLSNIMLSLQDNGLFVSTIASSANNFYNETRTEILNSDKWSLYFQQYTRPINVYSEQDIENMFNNAGFNLSHMTTVNTPFIFTSKDDFIAWMNTFSVDTRQLSADLQQEFINDVADLYLTKAPLLENGSVELYLPYIIAIAEKASN